MKGSAASLTCIDMYSEEVKEVSEAAMETRYLKDKELENKSQGMKLLNK